MFCDTFWVSRVFSTIIYESVAVKVTIGVKQQGPGREEINKRLRLSKSCQASQRGGSGLWEKPQSKFHLAPHGTFPGEHEGCCSFFYQASQGLYIFIYIIINFPASSVSVGKDDFYDSRRRPPRPPLERTWAAEMIKKKKRKEMLVSADTWRSLSCCQLAPSAHRPGRVNSPLLPSYLPKIKLWVLCQPVPMAGNPEGWSSHHNEVRKDDAPSWHVSLRDSQSLHFLM